MAPARCLWIAVALIGGSISAETPAISAPAPDVAKPAPARPLPPGVERQAEKPGKTPPAEPGHPPEEANRDSVAKLAPNTHHHRGHPPKHPPSTRNHASWLGVTIMRLPSEVHAQLPGLPRGVGFVVRRLADDGPAKKAGLAPNDVIWKINGQILVNEAQLWVLLGMWKPGEVVQIDYFRGGQPATTELTLGKAPRSGGFEVARNDGPFVVRPPGLGMPMHIVNVPRREASVESADGRAVLTFDQTGFRIKITDPKGRVIHDSPLFDADGKIQAPEAWRERVESLHSTLTESLKRSRGARPPRMRVIPKSKIPR